MVQQWFEASVIHFLTLCFSLGGVSQPALDRLPLGGAPQPACEYDEYTDSDSHRLGSSNVGGTGTGAGAGAGTDTGLPKFADWFGRYVCMMHTCNAALLALATVLLSLSVRGLIVVQYWLKIQIQIYRYRCKYGERLQIQ